MRESYPISGGGNAEAEQQFSSTDIEVSPDGSALLAIRNPETGDYEERLVKLKQVQNGAGREHPSLLVDGYANQLALVHTKNNGVEGIAVATTDSIIFYPSAEHEHTDRSGA